MCYAGAAAASKWCCQMQCSGSGLDAGRSGIASTDSDSSGVNYKPHRRRSEHRHRRKWFAPEWPTHGHSACQSVAAPQGAAVRDMRCCGCGCGCGWLPLQHTPVGPSTKAAAPCVCAMRVLRQRANGAARCNAVALVLMQAGHASRSVLPPKRLRRVCVMRVLRQQQLLLHPTECGPSASCSCELVASW